MGGSRLPARKLIPLVRSLVSLICKQHDAIICFPTNRATDALRCMSHRVERQKVALGNLRSVGGRCQVGANLTLEQEGSRFVAGRLYYFSVMFVIVLYMSKALILGSFSVAGLRPTTSMHYPMSAVCVIVLEAGHATLMPHLIQHWTCIAFSLNFLLCKKYENSMISEGRIHL